MRLEPRSWKKTPQRMCALLPLRRMWFVRTAAVSFPSSPTQAPSFPWVCLSACSWMCFWASMGSWMAPPTQAVECSLAHGQEELGVLRRKPE